MTKTTTDILPEELLIAVLHHVGQGTRIIDDSRLARIFNDAASQSKGSFRQFSWHPQYRYSKTLTDSLQALDHGGSILRENPASTYFSISQHTAGPWGKKTAESLDPEDRKLAEEIAAKIKEVFGGK